MYLDKPLKEHRLLQAVARTNRPFKDLKEAGLIIDYVGILKEFKRALEMYSKDEIEGALFSFDSLRGEFNLLINEILDIFKEIPREYDRQTMLKAIELLTSEPEKEKEFIEKYKNLRRVFELLGPDEIKLERFEEYKWISAIYTYYMKITLQKPSYEGYVRKFFDKTVRFVHKSTEVQKLEKELPVIVFDEDYLRNLEERVKSKEEKAANILFTLNRFVLVDRHKNPVYESLVERVEKLLKLWREKTKDYEKIYKEGAEIVKEIHRLAKRQKELGFTDMEYSMLLTLEKNFGKKKELIEDVKELSETLKQYMFSGWTLQATSRKKIEREVRKFVRRYIKKYGISLDEVNLLYERLIENVKNYGS